MRVHDSLDSAAHSNPATLFAISESRSLTYQDAAVAVDRITLALTRSGLGPGDRATIIAKNSIEFALLYFACSKAEIVLVPVNYRLATPEVAFILRDSCSAAVFAGKEFLAAIDQCRADLPGLQTFVALESSSAPTGWVAFDDWLGAVSSPSSELSHTMTSNPAAVQMYTSGTTGRPKGAILGQQSLTGTVRSCEPLFAGKPGDRNLLVLPMFHIFGAALTFTVPRVLGTLYIMRDFNPSAVLQSFREQAIVFAPLVPAMIRACLDQREASGGAYPNLKAIVYGASPIPEVILRRAIDTFACDFFQAYGMTEIAPITLLYPSSHVRGLDG